MNEFYRILDFHWSHDVGSQPDAAVSSSDGEGGEGQGGEGGRGEDAEQDAYPPLETVEVTGGEDEIPATQPDHETEEDTEKRNTSPEMPPPPVPVKSLPLPPSSAPSNLDTVARESAMMRVTALKNLSVLEKTFVFDFFPQQMASIRIIK